MILSENSIYTFTSSHSANYRSLFLWCYRVSLVFLDPLAEHNPFCSQDIFYGYCSTGSADRGSFNTDTFQGQVENCQPSSATTRYSCCVSETREQRGLCHLCPSAEFNQSCYRLRHGVFHRLQYCHKIGAFHWRRAKQFIAWSL